MNETHYLRPMVNLALLLYLSTVTFVAHTGSTLSVVFATTGVILIFSSHQKNDTTVFEKAVFGAFIFFPAIYLLSYLLNNWTDLLKNLRHLEDEFRMLLLFPMYFLFRKVKLSQKAIYNGIIGGAIASGAYAVLYFFMRGGERVSGAYDAIAFGDIALILAGMSVTSLDNLRSRHVAYRYLIPSAFVLGLVASILSGTRGTWAAIPVLLLILFFYMGQYLRMYKRLILAGLCGSILMGSYLVPTTHVKQRVDAAFAEVSGYLKGDVQYGGATVRLLGFSAAMEIYSDNPIIGAGPGNYRRLVEIMIKQGRLHKMTARHFLPSSIFLSSLATCGTLGFIALLGLFIAPLYLSLNLIRTHSDYRSIGYSLMMLVVGFFLFGLSEIIFRRSVFTSFYILLIAAFMAMAANLRESSAARKAATDGSA